MATWAKNSELKVKVKRPSCQFSRTQLKVKVEEGTGELATWAKNSKWKILRLGQTGFFAALLTYYGDLNQSNLLPSLSLSYRFGRFSGAKLCSSKNVDLGTWAKNSELKVKVKRPSCQFSRTQLKVKVEEGTGEIGNLGEKLEMENIKVRTNWFFLPLC